MLGKHHMVLGMSSRQVVLLLTARLVAAGFALVLLLLLLLLLLVGLVLPRLRHIHAVLQLLQQPPLLLGPGRVALLLQLVQLLPGCCCKLV
jgi:hypothetical protein